MEYVKGLLSICCTCYNHEQFVEDCIKSIWENDYKNVEIIILDDGSKDGSVKKLNELKAISPCPMEVIAQENTHNIGYNFNQTIKKARGEYITFMSADDMYTKEAFAKKIEMLNEDTNLAIVASNTKYELKKGNLTLDNSSNMHKLLKTTLTLDEMCDIGYRYGTFGLQGNIFRKEVVDAVHGFDEDISGDNLIITIKMLQYMQKVRTWNLKIVDFPSFIYRIHGNNYSGKSINLLEIFLDCYDRYWSEREYTQGIIDLIYNSFCDNPIGIVLKLLTKHPRALNLVLNDSKFYTPVLFSLKHQYCQKKTFFDYIFRVEPLNENKSKYIFFNKIKITVDWRKRNLNKLFRTNIKRYGHYLSLGYNCENAYRFFKKYHFVESSLFTWTNSIKIENLLCALKDINAIFNQEPEIAGVMWRDKSTDIRFHGIEPFEMHQNPEKYSDEDYKPYKEELVSRINHLKEKFISQITDDKKTLISYTYITHGETPNNIVENIKTMDDNLKSLKAKNYDLLVILEKKDNIDNFKDALRENIFIRYVDKFAPEADVLTKKYDKKSWSKILSEFRPAFKQKTTKKFKFDAK